jgi:aminopeptidase N
MSQPQTIRLEDYAAPSFLVERVDLRIEITEAFTEVRSALSVTRNPASNNRTAPLRLDGVELELVSITLDDIPLGDGTYARDNEGLLIEDMPDSATVEVVTRIDPAANTSLEGLYKADSAYCTQCEAEGFRKITYFPDRPDVMAVYSTTIIADRTACPVLLSNGNAVARGDLDDNRHWMTWEDPFPKPSYLFAVVAGDLASVEDTFTTKSGREVRLRIFVERHNLDKCDHAMAALRKSMAWDEEKYGLEYDLDLYMIVAVDDFNMGAMENKGLNVFNSKYVLARPDTATDADFENIEAVIAHEYFHNWTGNRVTCRDWFQLSLKEGLTVFRDQQFSADQGSPAVKRIQDVKILRTAQFAEDAGPMAHPIRPDEYIEINNFYTVTVYNKGAEVIRMIHTLVGESGFRDGMDLYFERHDGQAVTTDDFVNAMSDATGVDLTQFKRWYVQAGTPQVSVSTAFDPDSQELSIQLRQECPATPGQPDKAPFHIPVALGLLDDNGKSALIPGTPGQPTADKNGTIILELRETSQVFNIPGLKSAPTVSALRDFSAPVKLMGRRPISELTFLFGHDTDAFNRWDAGQSLFLDTLLRNVDRVCRGQPMSVDAALVDAVRATLGNSHLDCALMAQAITLPSLAYVAEQLDVIPVDAIDAARAFLRARLATTLGPALHEVYGTCTSSDPYEFGPEHIGRRALRNASLDLLMAQSDGTGTARATSQFDQADNMTDAMAALAALTHVDCDERLEALSRFEERWQHDSLVMDKWLSVQAMSSLPGTLGEVEALLTHEAFDLRKPNKVRALVGAFCQGNLLRFHDEGGAGYEFLTDQIAELDRLNPQVSAGLLGTLGRWRRFPDKNQALMRQALERVLGMSGLSRDCHEVATKTLGNQP